MTGLKVAPAGETKTGPEFFSSFNLRCEVSGFGIRIHKGKLGMAWHMRGVRWLHVPAGPRKPWASARNPGAAVTPAVLFLTAVRSRGSRARAPPFLTKKLKQVAVRGVACSVAWDRGTARFGHGVCTCAAHFPLNIDEHGHLLLFSSHFRKGLLFRAPSFNQANGNETSFILHGCRYVCETCVLDYEPASTPAVKLFSENSVVLYKHGTMYRERVGPAISIASIWI